MKFTAVVQYVSNLSRQGSGRPYLFGSASKNLKEHCPVWKSFVALTATAKSPREPEQTMPPVAALNQTAPVTTSFSSSAHAKDILWLHKHATPDGAATRGLWQGYGLNRVGAYASGNRFRTTKAIYLANTL